MRKTVKKTVIVPMLAGCARCGGDHENLMFVRLKRPAVRVYTHWAICPEYKEPLLMKLTEDK